MGDVQGDLPAVWSLLDLRHPAAHLPGQGPGLVGHHMAGMVHHVALGHHDVWAHERWPHVARPVGGGECREVLKHGWEAKCLVEDAAVLQVSKRIPAVGALYSKGNTSLCHVGCCQSEEVCLQKDRARWSPSMLFASQHRGYIHSEKPTPLQNIPPTQAPPVLRPQDVLESARTSICGHCSM